MRAKAPSAIKTRLENLWGCLVLLGFIILPIVLFIAVGIQSEIARSKQVAMNQAKASLLMALGDLPAVGLDGFGSKTNDLPGRLYGNFWIHSYTNMVVAGGKNFPCVLATDTWDGSAYHQGWLAVTTNGEFIWQDWSQAPKLMPKLIPPDYKVSKWRRGY